MVFGIGVPQAEIDAVLAPMRESNLRIQLIAGVIMLLISGWCCISWPVPCASCKTCTPTA
ncbi:hypothetical protein ULG90_08925 [Halopseudomonas pachastrellae]|nr:hypothetical protein ULG90_08925 [Halopseudomonas pachastrellae]